MNRSLLRLTSAPRITRRVEELAWTFAAGLFFGILATFAALVAAGRL